MPANQYMSEFNVRQILKFESPEPSDEKLMSMMQLGDRTAYEILFRRYYMDLYAYAYRYFQSKHHAEDAVHDIFVMLWEKRNRFDENKSLRGFLYTSLKNYILNTIRKKNRELLDAFETELVQNDDTVETSEPVHNPDLIKQIFNGIQSLTERKREIFYKKVLDGSNNEQVANELSISINTVKVHYNRSLKIIRAYLKDQPDLL
jgi:RNA polymerase sigma-70 factor (ECF subfamily)